MIEWRKATAEELANGSAEMVKVVEINPEPVDPILLETLRYKQRTSDGVDAYLGLMSELRLNSIANGLPRIVNKTIESKLKLVRDEVINGQWISAKEALSVVTPDAFLSQELIDRINTKLTEYIAANY